MLGKHTLGDSSQPQAKFAKPNFLSLEALAKLDHSATCNLFAQFKDIFNAIHKSTENETDKALTGIHLCNAVNSYRLDNNLNSMVNYLMEGNGVPNRDVAMFIAFDLIEKYITPSFSLHDREPLKGDALKKFLENQSVEEVKPTIESEGLYFKSTASREKQLEDFAKGIISRYSTFLLQLNRAQDSPLFEIRGPVGSGKTHFLLNATKEIAKKLSNNNWLEDEFNEIWDNNYINAKDQKPPTDWRKNLIESIENDIKIFATQRNGLSWNIEFQNLSAFEYIAAMLAIHYLSPKGRFKLDNFKTIPLDLDSVLDLIRDKFWKDGKLLLVEFCIDEIQLLIEGSDRKTSKLYELVRALHSTSSRRTDLLLIPVIGGTTFPSNDEDAQSNMNFVSLSGVANYVISLTPLMISKTIDLIKSDYFDEYKKLMAIGIQELANLLLLIGPFPRCVEMLIRGLKKSNDIIITSELYKTVKNKLLLKYYTKKESMIVNNAREIVEILRHILEGRTGLKDAIAQKALMRGLISYQKSGTISIIFVYLHIAICDNSILKADFDITFLDNYFDALLKGATHARLMEDLVASFITLKARIYHYLGQHSVKADIFFAGATLGKKVKDIILRLDKNMNYRSAKHCTDDKLDDIKTIELADGSTVDMTQNPTALVVGNQWTRGDGIITFNDQQAMIYETKKQKSTPFTGADVDDSFEHEQKMCSEFVSNLPQPLFFLYCNSGVTTIPKEGVKIISDYSMLVDQSNWLAFFRIIPKLYVTDSEKKRLIDLVPASFFQNSNPTIVTRRTTASTEQVDNLLPQNGEDLDSNIELLEVDLLCYEDI